MHRMLSRTAATASRVAGKRPRTMVLVALGMLGTLVYLWFKDRSHYRAVKTLDKEVEKWEGEGGNVPDVPSVHAAMINVPPTLH